MSLETIVINNIKRIRKEKGLSQEKLAEFCDTSASYIGLMETYKNIPKLSTIEKIAEALNVDPLTLFIDSENQNNSSNVENDQTAGFSSNITSATVSTQAKERLKRQILQNLDKTIDEVFQQI